MGEHCRKVMLFLSLAICLVTDLFAQGIDENPDLHEVYEDLGNGVMRELPLNSPYEKWFQKARADMPSFEGLIVQDARTVPLTLWPRMGRATPERQSAYRRGRSARRPSTACTSKWPITRSPTHGCLNYHLAGGPCPRGTCSRPGCTFSPVRATSCCSRKGGRRRKCRSSPTPCFPFP